ncbi:hypothetical protein F4810DRAFT_719052 [Camillea tinctor]|nr:hypothetical protein F4810DRAFT_719052 [Camillea tinctor]
MLFPAIEDNLRPSGHYNWFVRSSLKELVSFDGRNARVFYFLSPQPWIPDRLPSDQSRDDGEQKDGSSHYLSRKVCAVGAGVAGLYIAIIRDNLRTSKLRMTPSRLITGSVAASTPTTTPMNLLTWTSNLFNDHHVCGDVPDLYYIGVKNGCRVPKNIANNEVHTFLEEAFGTYKKRVAKDSKRGFKKLMKVDDFST